MTKYSKEEKLAAIKAVEAGESIIQVARKLQINISVLKWIVRSYHEHGKKDTAVM
jgi:transposase-like protein